MIEVASGGRVEVNGLAAIERHGDKTIGNLFDGAQFSIGDAQFLVGSRELNAVANREFSFDLPIDAHSRETLWVVGRLLPGVFLYGNKILLWVCRNNTGIAATLNSERSTPA
jgi:hypothetical protein